MIQSSKLSKYKIISIIFAQFEIYNVAYIKNCMAFFQASNI